MFNEGKLFVGGAVLMAVGFIMCIVYGTRMHPTDEEVMVELYINNCTQTNEFVGKNAERLYKCGEYKYKYSSIYQWAYDRKNP